MERAFKSGIIIALLFVCQICFSQESIRDTITASLKEARRGVVAKTGRVWSDIETMRKVISPIGEGDAIKFIQTLPGISAGAEGSSAIYARGGNLGNNLMSLDGVTIYGISHLLGMTSVVSPEVIASMDFQIGGFDADRGNMLSSYINLSSISPRTDRFHSNITINPFIMSASVTVPLAKRTGIFFSGRTSPVGEEYKWFKNKIDSEKGIHNFGAGIYDFYAKISHSTAKGATVAASFFQSMDKYNINMGKNSDDWNMGWSNRIGNLKFTGPASGRSGVEMNFSYNNFASDQSSSVIFNGSKNLLQMRSTIEELAENIKVFHGFRKSVIQSGFQMKFSKFAPGASSYSEKWNEQKLSAYTSTLWGQYEYRAPHSLYLKLALRANWFKTDTVKFFEPEISVLAEYNVHPNIKLTATLDRMVQFHHTLEGMPLGWSLDLIVPSNPVMRPESAYQAYVGAMGDFGRHKMSAGGYYKAMDNLVYYTDASAIFSALKTLWMDKIEIGKGSSYGLEAVYEYSDRKIDARAAYTLSKTDRTFASIYGGRSFPAKFDRRHILNSSVEWKIKGEGKNSESLSSAFTVQSGHWESVKSYSYPSLTPDDEFLIPHYNDRPNNLRMPAYIRLDISYSKNWTSRSSKFSYRFTAGIYNVLNRHNAFMLVYDDDADRWAQISLFPIMPNISFRVEF